jgi:hypothetical protein
LSIRDLQATEHYLVGFDARERWISPCECWNQQRRQAYLFRPDAPRPLSIDGMVWPSVFDLHPELQPDWTGFFCGLWDDLSRLDRCLMRAAGVFEGAFEVVAFSIATSFCTVDNLQCLHTQLCGVMPDGKPGRLPTTTPDSPQSNWTFLGFDVADLGGISALSNCGFNQEEQSQVAGLRKRWSRHIGAYHLFTHLEHANRFRLYSDKRVAEHAPFFVYGLWRVA